MAAIRLPSTNHAIAPMVACVLLAACATSPTTTAAAALIAVGVVIAFEGDLEAVESFTLRLDDGSDITFLPGEDAQFEHGPMSHIREHLTNGQPVRVVYVVAGDGSNLALAAGDA